MWAALPRNVAEKSHTNQNGDAEPERESGRVEVEQRVSEQVFLMI